MPQQHFGCISLSRVPVWCAGGQELTKEKKIPFLKPNLISCRCVSTKPINFLSLPKQPKRPSEGLPAVPEIQPAADRDPELAKSSQQLRSFWISYPAAATGQVSMANSTRAP